MICVQFNDSEDVRCENVDDVRRVVLDARASGEAITNIFECDADGEQLEGGQEYGCDWDVKIGPLGDIKKTITLPVHGIVLERGADRNWRITSDLERETCPYCDEPNCCSHCDESAEQALHHESYIHEDAVLRRLKTNGAIDAIESLILAHVRAGIDVETPVYLEGIETVIDVIGSHV